MWLGGTGAGLILAAKLLPFAARGIRVAGVNVCDDRAYFLDVIGLVLAPRLRSAGTSARTSRRRTSTSSTSRRPGLREEPAGGARDHPRCVAATIVLDPVYTGKAFHGVVTELQRDPKRFGETVAFLHTGGMFGLFASPETVAQVL